MRNTMYYERKCLCMSSISLRLSEEESTLIRNYASMHNMSVSDLIRRTMMEKIEDEYDLSAYEKAYDAYLKDPQTYTLDEVEKELGLS